MATKVDLSLALVYEDMKMKFIPEKIYQQYTEDNDLTKFDIIHLFKELPCLDLDQRTTNPDCCKFTLWGFNTDSDTKVNLGEFEFIEMTRGARVKTVFIYADGSTFIKFSKLVNLINLAPKALITWF